MKQVQRVLANYCADLGGVCSALYELGGLIVMHDASGCNSTYATHDEPRWYDMDSLIFISALEEYDMVLGNDQKFIDDVAEVADEKHPKFIAIFGSPIALVCGTDFKGVARLIEQRTGIPTFAFQTSGMYTYQNGARQAFEKIADFFCPNSIERKPHTGISVNLLGVTPLDFSVVGNVEGLHAFLQRNGFTEQSCWSMGDSLEQLETAGQADVNLVVSSVALDAAKVLRRKYGTPYVIGIPIGPYGERAVADAIREAADSGEKQILSSDPPTGADRRRTLLIGEPVFCSSLRACLEQDCGCGEVQVICPLEDDIGLLRDSDCRSDEEDDIRRLTNEADRIIADPIYRRVAPPTVPFTDFPQEACSGRQFRAEIPVFVAPEFDRWLKKNNC